MIPITTVLSAAATQDLTDLATAKSELGLDSVNIQNDVWLARAVTQVSRSIARHVNRVFAPEYVQDLFEAPARQTRSQVPLGLQELQLARWPVVTIASVTQTLAGGASQTLTEGVDFIVDDDGGRLLRLCASSAGLVTAWEPLAVTVRYIAGYGGLATESHNVPGAGPYQVQVSQAAAFSCDRSVSYAGGAALTAVAGAPAHGQYSVSAGTYLFNAADAGQALGFVYAVRALPDDLAEIALRLITARFKAKDRDPALIQQETPGIGVQRWWFGSAPGQTGPFPPDIEADLEDYRTPAFG